MPTNPVAISRQSRDGDKIGEVILMWCPGCDDLVRLPVAGDLMPQWKWNFDPRKPTIEPSILEITGEKRCHSFLRDGVWEFLSDCTHEYANQTVPMVPLPDWVLGEGL